MAAENVTNIIKNTQSSATTVSLSRPQEMFNAMQGQMNKIFADFMNTPSLLSLWRSSNLWHNHDFWRSTPFNMVEPALDIHETDKNYSLRMELPGVEQKDVKITINDNSIIIKGEKEQSRREEKDNCLRCECSYGSFQRTVYLPETANTEDAKAIFKNGVLTVEMPKRAAAISHKTRQLDIKAA